MRRDDGAPAAFSHAVGLVRHAKTLQHNVRARHGAPDLLVAGGSCRNDTPPLSLFRSLRNQQRCCRRTRPTSLRQWPFKPLPGSGWMGGMSRVRSLSAPIPSRALLRARGLPRTGTQRPAPVLFLASGPVFRLSLERVRLCASRRDSSTRSRAWQSGLPVPSNFETAMSSRSLALIEPVRPIREPTASRTRTTVRPLLSSHSERHHFNGWKPVHRRRAMSQSE